MEKKVNINLEDIIDSLELDFPGVRQFLNTETGGVIIISESSDSFDENGDLIDIDDLDNFLDEKFIELPKVDSAEGYRDMEAFIETIKNPNLRNKLENALRQRRPFRRFKDVLMGLAEEERWYKFKSTRNRKRALEWLAENNLEAFDNTDL
ncbi:MAG: UPF0158 family protein [Acidobacteria bacterium]|nr:UPF0158 family protein [Acidobacteriota bacterium]